MDCARDKVLAFKETETLELKTSTSELKEAVISIVAMLNKHYKGTLYFGIKDDGIVLGQSVSPKTLRDISKTIADYVEPKIFPEITHEVIDDKDCIKVEIHGTNIPYYAYGRAYMRVSDEDRKLSAKKIEEMILRKNKDKLRWDGQICKKATLKDISSYKFRKFLKLSNLKHDTVLNSLEKLSLVSHNMMLNTAVILFGKKPETFFPNARLRCAVFGTESTSFTIDMTDFYGDLFYLIDMAEAYVLKNIHIGMKLDGLRRIDVPEINKEALREAIINAFCHRDYYKYDSVNVAVFKDRVEIRNPGKLYDGLTIDEIVKGNVSKRRNELIAEMFNKVHYVEKWGRGIELILSKEPETEFKEAFAMFVTVFKRKKAQVGVQVGVQAGVQVELIESEYKILNFIRLNESVTLKDIVFFLGYLTRTKNVRHSINKLLSNNLIELTIPDRPNSPKQKYKITQKGSEALDKR